MAIERECDIHNYVYGIKNVAAVYDGPTQNGQWGYMCEECLISHGKPGSTMNKKLSEVK